MQPNDLFQEFERYLAERAKTFLGYPCSLAFNYEPLTRFTQFSLNNVGDPYSESLYALNSTMFEREVVSFFCNLYELPAERAWGYVTASGSEGNLYGLYLGREACPNGILFYSTNTHYSVAKAARLLALQEHPVASLPNGEIDYDALEAAIAAHPGRPVIISANIGTTMLGAVDDVGRIADILRRNRVERFYIHCDAALLGMVLPFVPGERRKITFAQPIGSVSVSGHKFLGSPAPCGIVVTHNEHVDRIRRTVEYVGAIDATIGGSRNGQSPLYLWHTLQTRGANDGFRREVAACLENADYLRERLEAIGIPTFMNPSSLTVVFDEPTDALVRKWCLARQKGRVHIVTVPHATRSMIDAFVDELGKARGSDELARRRPEPPHQAMAVAR